MILDLFSLDGQVALVTGANRGLGQGLAIALAQAGADVVLLTSGSDASETKARVEAAGSRAHIVHCDLLAATPADLRGVVDEAIAEFGRLDILVNNAGIIRRQPAIEFSEDNWNDVLQVNLTSAFFLAQAAARPMIEAGAGRIINIASMLSYQGGVFVPSYTAAKSGVAGLTKALANEWAKLGVTVNAIAPGYMATDNTAALRADEDRSASILDRIPAGRWGTPDDLAGAVVFLASEAASYVNGTTLDVDGGWLAR